MPSGTARRSRRFYVKRQGSERLRLLLWYGAAVLGLFVFDYFCPFRHLLGISCAGCGMTRSWVALFGGQLGEALRLHPLFWMPPVAAGLWFFRKKALCRGLLWGCGAVFLALWVVRLASPADTVAVFSPRDGVLYRLLEELFL